VAQVRLFWREAAPSHVGISRSTNNMLPYLIHTAHARTHEKQEDGQELNNNMKSKSQPNLFPLRQNLDKNLHCDGLRIHFHSPSIIVR
jgi:hypothetical protein